ncbi:MAG: glycosyltransferase [Prevotella sp.]|nr:glycosyltransferase [Prevotella sp.]
MRILYFIDTMQFGGAAKKTAMIANELSRKGHEVIIVTDINLDVGFALDESIRLLPLYEENKQGNRAMKMLRKLRRVRSLVKSNSPDIVVSVLPHVSFYVKIALTGMRVPVVFSDETSFARNDSMFVHFIRHRFYNVADAVVVLTENDIKLLGTNIPKKVAIHNPVACPDFNQDYAVKEKIILAIGALKEWDIKGFDLLFQAFQPLAESFPDWKIVIAGDAKEPYMTKVQAMINHLNLDGRVELLGYQSDIFSIMAKTSIYALSSRIEGFSLSLVEALSQGCACVAFENYGVINEVTCGGKGVLVVKDGDVNGFSNQLRLLMESLKERKRLAEDGKPVVSAYSMDKIVTQWEDLFFRLCGATC